MKKIHPTQQKLLDILTNNQETPLTIREIQSELELSSTSLVHHHIRQLEKKGYLKKNDNYSNSFEVIKFGNNNIYHLNLYGLAECGPNGRILDGEPVDTIPVSAKLTNCSLESAFLVKASGDSMQPRIHEGDLVIASKSNNVENGNIVVCTYMGKALIKKINLNNDLITLESLNKSYEAILIENDSLHIEGIVKAVLKNSMF